MEQVIRIGMDTSKHIFQIHGVNEAEEPILRRKFRRKEMIAFFEKLEPAEVTIEACAASHHWARLLRSFGHEVKLIAPQLVTDRQRNPGACGGIWPDGAVMLALKTPAPEMFRSSRHFAAWLGLTPKDHSTGGKTRLGKITRAGDEGLRSVLVAGATSVLSHYRGKEGHGAVVSWFNQLLERKPPKLVAVALANKIARIAWKLMVSGERYQKPMLQAA